MCIRDRCDACEEIREQYDFIIIDTPPTLGCMLSNALTFADEVVIPVTCDRYGMEGISDLYVTIHATQKYTNRNLRVTGVLLNKYKEKTTLCREISEALPSLSLIHICVNRLKVHNLHEQ